jgi:hypothetical protein
MGYGPWAGWKYQDDQKFNIFRDIREFTQQNIYKN